MPRLLAFSLMCFVLFLFLQSDTTRSKPYYSNPHGLLCDPSPLPIDQNDSPSAQGILLSCYLPATLASIVKRKSIDIPAKMRRFDNRKWEALAASFLQQYYALLYQDKAKLISDGPPTECLTHVKGFITGKNNFWENVEIRLDNFQLVNKQLSMDCSIDGYYIPQNTPRITDAAFLRPCILQNDFATEMNSICLTVMDDFKTYLNN